MAYKIYDKGRWVLIEFTGEVDAFDVFTQNQESGFLDMLAGKAGIIANYSEAESVNINAEEIDSFAKVAAMQATITGPLNIVIVPRPIGIEKAQAYRQLLTDTNWRVLIAKNMSEALELVFSPHSSCL